MYLHTYSYCGTGERTQPGLHACSAGTPPTELHPRLLIIYFEPINQNSCDSLDVMHTQNINQLLEWLYSSLSFLKRSHMLSKLGIFNIILFFFPEKMGIQFSWVLRTLSNLGSEN